MRKGFKEMGYNVGEHDSAVVPVIIGDTDKVLYMWRQLFNAGVFVNAFIRPGVPPGLEMLRTSYMATHEDEHLDKILDIMSSIGKKLGVIH
jgi:8-amino-7-oxononanoate synthase